MSRVYAEVAATGEQVFVRLECDYCDATIKPVDTIGSSGWKKWGVYYTPGDDKNTEVNCCPECVDEIPLEAMS